MAVLSKQSRRDRLPRERTTFPDTRHRLLWAGVEILTERGFSAVGLDEILRPAGIPKGSFYYYFPSKDQFGLTLIDTYDEYFCRKLDRFFGNVSRPPLSRLGDFVADAKAGMARYDYRRGCLIGNVGQEMGNLPEAFRDRLSRVFDGWQERTASCLREAQSDGAIGHELDCDRLAAFFWIGWEGAVLRAKLDRRGEALDLFSDHFFDSLKRL